MVNYLILILIVAVVTIVGGGAGYLLWLKTRPKKRHFSAKIYTIAEGRSIKRLKKGGNIKLHDLNPYAMDIVEVIQKKAGVITRLKGLKKIISDIDPEVVENWGKDSKVVNCVYNKGEILILKKRFDKDNNTLIFDPLPQSRVNLIKTEIRERQNRLKDEKDLLAAVTPWIVAGIIMVGLVACSWIMTEGYLKISTASASAANENRKTIESAERTLTQVASTLSAISGTPTASIPTPSNLGAQNNGS